MVRVFCLTWISIYLPSSGQAARNGDADAIRIIEGAGRYLGLGLSIAVNLLNPSRIILGGGVMDMSDLLWPSWKRNLTPGHTGVRKRW
ncbi:hypothetical protein N752_00770 [Desulforamulus aquiferis]|nr:ROK family protein [Desulforamulus aquiferis]RYD07148.1 hypothetical protein N752_00770 [Desulforamulus aquiferis]